MTPFVDPTRPSKTTKTTQLPSRKALQRLEQRRLKAAVKLIRLCGGDIDQAREALWEAMSFPSR